MRKGSTPRMHVVAHQMDQSHVLIPSIAVDSQVMLHRLHEIEQTLHRTDGQPSR